MDKLPRIPRDWAPSSAWGGVGMSFKVFQGKLGQKRDEQVQEVGEGSSGRRYSTCRGAEGGERGGGCGAVLELRV